MNLMMNVEILEMTVPSDGHELHGVLHLPKAGHPPVIIGSHGLLSTGDSPKQIALAQALNQHGVAFFRFDHRGCGRSSGRFADSIDLDARRRDLVHAVRAVLECGVTASRMGLFGSSMGGATCIAAARDLAPAVMATYAAPIRSADILATVHSTGIPEDIDPEVFKAAFRFDLSARLGDLHNILIIHGDADQVVPTANAHELHARARSPKRLVIQPGGDHPMTDESHQREFLEEVVKWLAKVR